MVASNALNRKFQRMEDIQCFRDEVLLRRRLQDELGREQHYQDLARACPQADRSLVHRLMEAGFHRQTLAALHLAPIAIMAWASGDVTEEERAVVMRIAKESSLKPGDNASRLLESWLVNRPSSDLLRLWADFIRAQTSRLPRSVVESIGDRIHRQAIEVATASGGLLGIGKICMGEQDVLDRLSETFH